MGERSPHKDPLAKGSFVGMTLDTKREEMTQAVFEGVAFALRDSLEVAKQLGIKIDETNICGGGAKSDLWKQIMANVLGIKINTVEVEEGPAYGGAILAAVGNGEYESVVEAAKVIVKQKDSVMPDKKLTALYEERYQTFKKLYPALKLVMQEI